MEVDMITGKVGAQGLSSYTPLLFLSLFILSSLTSSLTLRHYIHLSMTPWILLWIGCAQQKSFCTIIESSFCQWQVQLWKKMYDKWSLIPWAIYVVHHYCHLESQFTCKVANLLSLSLPQLFKFLCNLIFASYLSEEVKDNRKNISVYLPATLPAKGTDPVLSPITLYQLSLMYVCMPTHTLYFMSSQLKSILQNFLFHILLLSFLFTN